MTTVSAGQAPRRLDVFVSTQTAHLSRASAQRWIDGGLPMDLLDEPGGAEQWVAGHGYDAGAT